MEQTKTSDTTSNPWQRLYKIGCAATLLFILYCLATMMIMVFTGGQPTSVEETFHMLQENRIVGLLRLDLLTVFFMPLYYLIFLGIFLALKRIGLVYTTLATVLVFAGLTLFLATPSVFSYLILSDKYAAASTEAVRSQVLAVGEAILASDMWHGTGAIIGGILMQTGAVLISVVMLRGTVFGKAAAIVGILTHGLDLAHILVGFVAPEVGVLLMAVAGPIYLVWLPLVARGFFRLARESGDVSPQPAVSFSTGE